MTKPDREELSWAAGFFDGEGTTYGAGTRKGRNFGSRLAATVPQTNIESLERFRRAVLGLGKIHLRTRHLAKPTHKPCYVWQTQNWRDTQAVLALLWFKLGEPKKAQAISAVKIFRECPHWGASIGNPNWVKGYKKNAN